MMMQQIKQPKNISFESEYKQNTEISLTRCSKVDNQFLEKEIDIEENLSKQCQIKQKCSKCQDEMSYQIQDKIYCKDCLKCLICSQLNPIEDIILISTYFTHKSCSKIFQRKNELKLGILEIMRRELGTIVHIVKVKTTENYFTCQKFECVEFENYADHVVGYHHFLVKNKREYDPKTFKVLKTKAEQYLIEDFLNAEDKVAKLLIGNGKKISDISENVLMLFISAAFIFREEYLIKPLLTSIFSNNYNHLYHNLLEFKCKQIKKHNCTIKSKLKYILDFFNDRFHREDGRIREKQKIPNFGFIQRTLPSKRR